MRQPLIDDDKLRFLYFGRGNTGIEPLRELCVAVIKLKLYVFHIQYMVMLAAKVITPMNMLCPTQHLLQISYEDEFDWLITEGCEAFQLRWHTWVH